MSELNGIICINKPRGFTSFDVAAVMRKAAGTRKIGHGGTLDPNATGVLPVFIGRAAKTVDLNPNQDKRYHAHFRLGIQTDTQDVWGETLKTSDRRVTKEELCRAVEAFNGDILQTPPMYSAVRVDGKRLYELARKGIEVERKARPITVYSAAVLSFDEDNQCGELDVKCSKGTYIRTLINDIGETLGSYASMSGLMRTEAAGFSLCDCIELEKARAMTTNELGAALIPTERIFSRYAEIQLDKKQRSMFINGAVLDCGKMGISPQAGEILRLKYEESFVGAAKCGGDGGLHSIYLNELR